MPYRIAAAEVETPPKKASLASALVALAIVHGLSFVVLWVLFAVLRWTGENGLLGFLVRGLGSIVILALAALGARLASEHPGRASVAMARAIAFGAVYLGVVLAIRAGGALAPLIFPRAGAISAPPSFLALLASAVVNPGILMVVLFGINAAAANKRRLRERALQRLRDVPCSQCGGRMAEKVDHLECTSCGLSAPLATEADIEALAKMTQPPESR